MCLEGLLALLRLERLHSGIFSGTISTEAIRPIITSPESFFNSLTTIGKVSIKSSHLEIISSLNYLIFKLSHLDSQFQYSMILWFID